MKRSLFPIFIALFLISCGGDPLETEFDFEDQFVYEQITGTFYQIEAHLESKDPNFDFIGSELTTERVEIEHCRTFRGIQGDTVELWDRSVYNEVVDKIREGKIYNIEYDKMLNTSGFDKTLGMIGDKMRNPEFSVPKALNEAAEAYQLDLNNFGQITITKGSNSTSYNVTPPIVSEYKVTLASTNREVEIEETHHIVKIIQNPIIKYPKQQYFCN